MSYIYVASPYTGDEALQRDRHAKVEQFVAEWTRRGQVLYSPIVHFHPMSEKFNLPTTFDFWKEHNLTMLRHASALWVYTLPGWDKSKGVLAEMKLARDLLLPMKFQELPGHKSKLDFAHQTRYSDSSLYDEKCVLCGATDASGDARLQEPCPGAKKNESSL